MTGGGSWPTSLRSSNGFGDARIEPRESGSTRKKLAGYLKAANELRQAAQSSWSTRDGASDMPGSFPEAVAMGKVGDEEMILFPSYARRHVKEKVGKDRRDGAHREAQLT